MTREQFLIKRKLMDLAKQNISIVIPSVVTMEELRPRQEIKSRNKSRRSINLTHASRMCKPDMTSYAPFKGDSND